MGTPRDECSPQASLFSKALFIKNGCRVTLFDTLKGLRDLCAPHSFWYLGSLAGEHVF